jgi:hypothetical protein
MLFRFKYYLLLLIIAGTFINKPRNSITNLIMLNFAGSIFLYGA